MRSAAVADRTCLGTSDADKALIDRLVAAGAADWPSIKEPREAWWMRCAVGLIAPLWVPLIVFAALVRLGRGRLPVIVLQERAGFDRQPIVIPKIATMSLPSNRRRFGGLVELSTEAGGDPAELAGVDRWLRHSGLDELPQLALIVLGRMRLVGPRPATFGELAQMTHVAALDGTGTVGVDLLAPGLIGVWQILDRHAYSMAERQAFDRFMTERWSPALQRTIVRVAAGQAVRRLFGRS